MVNNTTQRPGQQFNGRGLGAAGAAASSKPAYTPKAAAAGSNGGGDGKKGKRPAFNVKVKGEDGKYLSVGAIFENVIQVTDKQTGQPTEITTRTLTVKEALQPGQYYSVFTNDYQDKD